MGALGSLEDHISEEGHLLILLLEFLSYFLNKSFNISFFLSGDVKGSLEDQISEGGHSVIPLFVRVRPNPPHYILPIGLQIGRQKCYLNLTQFA